MQKVFKALSDENRRKILHLLKEKQLTPGELAEHLECNLATLSHHLSILKGANLISDNKVGKNIFYQLNTTVFDEIILMFMSFKK